MDTQVQEMAHRFNAVIESWFSREVLEGIDADNRAFDAAGQNTTCATHDHADTNMAMDEAFTAFVGHSLDGESATDCALWGSAWTLARAHGFSVPFPATKAPAASSGPCPECKDTGWYVGYRKREHCSRGCPQE